MNNDKEIRQIYNAFATAYSNLSNTKDMGAFNNEIDDIKSKVLGNNVLIDFYNALLVAWCPVANKVMEQQLLNSN